MKTILKKRWLMSKKPLTDFFYYYVYSDEKSYSILWQVTIEIILCVNYNLHRNNNQTQGNQIECALIFNKYNNK